GVSLTSGDAAFEALPDSIFRQIAANEDNAAVALLVSAPGALVIAIEDHMHTLEDKTLGVILERQYALAAQNTGTVLDDEILNPRKELVWIERLVGLDRNRLHLFVVVVLEAVSVMMMVMAVLMIVIMMVVMIMMVIIGVQKRRLDVE